MKRKDDTKDERDMTGVEPYSKQDKLSYFLRVTCIGGGPRLPSRAFLSALRCRKIRYEQ